jgi:hypothetical protein
MSFLDRSSLIVDAVLTDKGREELSKNQFEIVKFALGDDDIDYTLYNESNSNGPNFYGVAIENMPLLEAFTNSTEALRYKLITREIEAPERQPQVSPTIPNSVDLVGTGDFAMLTPSVINSPGNEGEEFIFELDYDDQDVDIVLGNFGEQRTPEVFQVSISQVDTNRNTLRAAQGNNISINGNDLRPIDGFARMEFTVSENNLENVLNIVRESDRTVTAIRSTGGVRLEDPRDRSLVSVITNPDNIYNQNGVRVIVNGNGTLTMLVESNERSGDDRSSSDSGAFTDIQVQATDRALNEPRSNAGIFRALIDAGLLSEGGRVELRYRYNGQQSRTYGVVGFNAQRTRIDLNNRVPREAQGAQTLRLAGTFDQREERREEREERQERRDDGRRDDGRRGEERRDGRR